MSMAFLDRHDRHGHDLRLESRSPDEQVPKKRHAREVPIWVIALGVPAAALAVLPLYVALAFVPAGTGRSVEVWRVYRLLIQLYGLYGIGYILFGFARSR